jgi:heme A synthase
MRSAGTPLAPSDLVRLDGVRVQFARVWLVGAGVIFFIMVIQSLRGVYADKTQEAWGWFLPTVLPSLLLIMGVLTYTALDPNSTNTVVRKTFVPIARWLSIAYIFTVLLTILMQPLAGGRAEDAIALMRTSNLWLGPFQGLVSSALGVLFVSKQKHP